MDAHLTGSANGEVGASEPARAEADATAHGVRDGDRKLLVLDTSNSFELIRARSTEDSVTCRDLGGYFSHVWSVHPVATLTTSEQWTPRNGPPVHYRVNDRHTFIEGKIGRFPSLSRLFVLNFLIAQIGLIRTLSRLIRKERISVIRAGDPLYTGLLSWALSRWHGIPFVVRVGGNHDKVYETTGQPIQPRLFKRRSVEKKVERFVFRRADLVAAANSDYVEFSVANGARRERTTLFPYGNLIDKRHFTDPGKRSVDPDRLAELGIERGRFLIYVGRLEPVKHPDDVVRLLALLHQRGHALKAVLVGEGFEQPALAALARELGIGDHIVFAGSRGQDWLAEMIPCAAAVVSPITGRSLSEAALAGVPIAAYDIDWQRDLIETGVTGELVPFRSVEGLADSVEKFLTDPDYARRMGRGLRQRALDMLDHERLDEHERQQYSALFERAGHPT